MFFFITFSLSVLKGLIKGCVFIFSSSKTAYFHPLLLCKQIFIQRSYLKSTPAHMKMLQNSFNKVIFCLIWLSEVLFHKLAPLLPADLKLRVYDYLGSSQFPQIQSCFLELPKCYNWIPLFNYYYSLHDWQEARPCSIGTPLLPCACQPSSATVCALEGHIVLKGGIHSCHAASLHD